MGGTRRRSESGRAKDSFSRMNLALHIERLILDGLPLSRPQSVALQNALEGELSRLLANRDTATLTAGSVPQVAIPAVQLSASGEPAQWGRQIAHALYRGIAQAPANSIQSQNFRGGLNPPPSSRHPAAQ